MNKNVFFDLNPSEILDAVDSVLQEMEPGLRCTGRVITLNSLENRVFELELEDSSSIVTKFYRPQRWTGEQIQEEHDFVQYLEDLEIPVVPPFRIGDDSLFISDNEIFFALFPKVRGRLSDELNKDQLITLGRYMARIHNTSELFPLRYRLNLNVDTWGYDSLKILLQNSPLPPEYKSKYENTCNSFFQLASPLLNQLPVVNCHGDCHLGNVLWNGDSPFLIDFDDLVTAPAVQDLWTMIRGRDERALQDREFFLEGYSVFRPFDRTSLHAIEALRGLRMIQYSSWIAKRWDDPAFKKSFPDFSLPRYWEEEIQSIYEVIDLLQRN